MRIRKYKKARSPHRVFLVICEGETEETYINLLKRHYRLPITIKTKVIGNYINARLINQYIKELGVSAEECSVFHVYDADVKAVLEKILSLPGKAVISNPCIELWFALHLKDFNRAVTSEAIVRELSLIDRIWKSYGKGGLTSDQAKHLVNNKDMAIERAKRLKWPLNPSSNMYDFIDALENEKNAEVTLKVHQKC